MPIQRIELYQHQYDIVNCRKRKRALFGGVGSGKSFAMMLCLMQHCAMYPGTNVLIIRKVASDIKKTIWNDFQEAFYDNIKTINKQEMFIMLKNKTKVFFVHGWDPERGLKHLDAYNISSFLISQAEEVPEGCYRKLIDRSRRKKCLPNLSNRKGIIPDHEFMRLIEGNPRGKDWIWKNFCDGAAVVENFEEVGDKSTKYNTYIKDDSILIQVESGAYSFVPQDYLKSLMESHSERYIQRYVLGKFDSFTGLVYDVFNKEHHCIEPYEVKKKPDPRRYLRIVSFDWGFRNPTAVLWAIYDMEEDMLIAYREYYQNGLTATQQAERVLDLSEGERIDFFVADPSIWNTTPSGSSVALDLINVFNERLGMSKLPIIASENELDYGVEQVHKQMLIKEENGVLSSGFYLFNDMYNFINEIENYKYPEDVDTREPKTNLKEEPLKKNDHLMDALRYMILSKKLYSKESMQWRDGKKRRTLDNDGYD